MGTTAHNMAPMIDQKVGLGAILVLSFIECWAAIAYCAQRDDWGSKDCDKEWAWAVCVGLLSAILSLVMLLLLKFKPELMAGKVSTVLIFILFAMWIAGMAVCTFDKPFAPGPGSSSTASSSTYSANVAGNGYFATWLALAFSTVLLLDAVPQIGASGANVDMKKKMLAGVFFMGLIELWHSSRVCDDDNDCEGMLAWGVAAGAIGCAVSLIWAILTQFVASLDDHTKFVAGFLTVWWLCAVCSLTMPNKESSCSSGDTYCQGLFLDVSNGFIGCWGALLLSVVLTAECFGLQVVGESSGTSSSTTTTTTTTSKEVNVTATASGHSHSHGESEPKSAGDAQE